MKFKIGDKVKITKINHEVYKCLEESYVNRIATITRICYGNYPYLVDFDDKGINSICFWSDDELKLIDDSKDNAKLEMFGELVRSLDKALKEIKYMTDEENMQDSWLYQIATLNKAKELMRDV